MSRSVANGGSMRTVPSARLSCSSMYAWTAVPEGYDLATPSMVRVAVVRPLGATDGGLRSKPVLFKRQASVMTVTLLHGLETPCNAAPLRAGAGRVAGDALSG